jgi:hypothetical protein
MEKRKNGQSNGNGFLVAVVVLVLLAVTGLLPAAIQLIIGIVLGIVGLVVGLVAGVIGLVVGLIGGLIGIVVGLLPIVLTIAVVVLIVKAINGNSGKRKNDDIDYV